MKARLISLLTVVFLAINSISFAAADLRYINGMPVTGQETVYKSVDEKVAEFMRIHQIKAASVAIMKDGVIELNHGYGYSDRKGRGDRFVVPWDQLCYTWLEVVIWQGLLEREAIAEYIM